MRGQLIILICFYSLYSSVQSCFFDSLTLDITETGIIERLSKLLENNNTPQISVMCLESLLERGYYRAALELYEQYFMLQKIDIVDQIRNLAANRKKHLDKFIMKISSAKSQVQQIAPVIVWAQNKNYTFVQIKLAMRWDAPACLHCEHEKIEITENKLYFSSFGILSTQPIRWVLDLELEKSINVQESYYEQNAVGTLVFNLSKTVKNELWRNLGVNTTKKSVGIW